MLPPGGDGRGGAAGRAGRQVGTMGCLWRLVVVVVTPGRCIPWHPLGRVGMHLWRAQKRCVCCVCAAAVVVCRLKNCFELRSYFLYTSLMLLLLLKVVFLLLLHTLLLQHAVATIKICTTSNVTTHRHQPLLNIYNNYLLLLHCSYTATTTQQPYTANN